MRMETKQKLSLIMFLCQELTEFETMAPNTLLDAREARNDSSPALVVSSADSSKEVSECGNNHVMCCSVMCLCPLIILYRCCHNVAKGSLNKHFYDLPILRVLQFV